MRYLALALVLLTAVGCTTKSTTKPSTAGNSVMDVQPIASNVPAYKPEPVAFSPAPAPAPEVMTTATPTSYSPVSTTGNTHVVKKGETMYSIAKAHYGNGKQWQRIASANPAVSPSGLKVGQTLIIP